MVRFMNDSQEVDRTSSKQIMVVGAGLPRAATSSIQMAFEELGYDPCLHMANVLPHVDRTLTIIEAIEEEDKERRQKLLHQLFDGYMAICDFPVIPFGADLMDMYPDAKIVLNGRRSAEVWSTSVKESLGFFFTQRFRFCGALFATDRAWYQMNMAATRWVQRKFGDDVEIDSAAMYTRYYEHVRREAAARGKEVLEFQAEDGWEPLCKFLDRPVPATPFPRTNEKKTMAIIKAVFIVRGLTSWAVLGGSVWAAWAFRGPVVGLVRRSLPRWT